IVARVDGAVVGIGGSGPAEERDVVVPALQRARTAVLEHQLGWRVLDGCFRPDLVPLALKNGFDLPCVVRFGDAREIECQALAVLAADAVRSALPSRCV